MSNKRIIAIATDKGPSFIDRLSYFIGTTILHRLDKYEGDRCIVILEENLDKDYTKDFSSAAILDILEAVDVKIISMSNRTFNDKE